MLVPFTARENLWVVKSKVSGDRLIVQCISLLKFDSYNVQVRV